MITVYTVITDNYDNLRPPVQCALEADVQFVCFTDRPRFTPPWQTQAFPQVFGVDARRNSRIPKCLPHLLLDTDYSIYLDGAYVLQAPPSHLIRDLLGDADLAIFAHPTNKSIHDERNFYQNLHGYVPADIEAEYQKYLIEALPINGQFWAGGFLIRRHNDQTARFNEIWMRSHLEGSSNDQFSLYRAVVTGGVNVRSVPEYPHGGNRLWYALHANSHCADNPAFESENARWDARIARIRELCA